MGDGQAAAMVAAAVARTRAAGSARIELQIGERILPAVFDRPIRVVRHPMRSFARWFVKNQSLARTTQGLIDFRARRYMLFGPYAQVHADGELWGGAPGRSLSSLTHVRYAAPVPLWLFDLLDGVHHASESGLRQVHGLPCGSLTGQLDVRGASTSLPSQWSADPASLRPEIWIDGDGHIRRVQVHAEDRTQSLELWDFGARVDDLDWTHLPTFQPAEEG